MGVLSDIVSAVGLGSKIGRQFSYDVHGWLTGSTSRIVHNSLLSDSLTIKFRSSLTPGTGVPILPQTLFTTIKETLMYADGKTPRYNGNISSRVFSGGRYDYTYDELNRLTNASYTDPDGKGRNYSSAYSYDSNSNITSLSRYGVTDRVGTSDIYSIHSNIMYTYTGNQVTELGSGANGVDYEGRTGFPCDGTWTLRYDANGNVKYDESRRIGNISYNHLNQPAAIRFTSGDLLENSYSGAGVKWQSRLVSARGTVEATTQYVGDAVFRDGELSMIRFEGGYFDGDGNAYYYITDYQGNVTHTVAVNGTIEQTVNYYADGEPWGEPTGDNPYLFGAKERVTLGGLNQYDFGARMYNSSASIWGQQDPYAEKYYDLSPYCAMGANPVMNTDPTGMITYAKSEEEQKMIKYTVPAKERLFLSFDEDGMLSINVPEGYQSESNNFQMLQEMAESKDYIVDVILTQEYEYIDADGNYTTGSLKEMEDAEYLDNAHPGSPPFVNEPGDVGLLTNEEGNFGKTLFPGTGHKFNSPDDHIKVLVNSTTSERGRPQAFSHEGYGHAHTYIETNGSRLLSVHWFRTHEIMNKDGNIYIREKMAKSIIETNGYWNQ